MRTVDPSVALIHATQGPARVVEAMGRKCYQSQHKICADSENDFVKRIIRNGHESVLEHVSAGFAVITDRGVTHELVRHRVGIAFTQESTRYCDYSGPRLGGELTLIQPPGLDEDEKYEWRLAMGEVEKRYIALRRIGTPAEIARSVLPNALKAEIGVTANARAWRHFLRLRLSPKAHPQMREIARLLCVELRQWFPAAFEEFSDPLPGV